MMPEDRQKQHDDLRYLTRVLSALCKQHDGEIRVPMEMVDVPGEPTRIQFLRDRKSQELIVRTAKENEVVIATYAVIPESTVPRAVAAGANGQTIDKVPEEQAGLLRSKPQVSDERLAEMERILQRNRVGAMVREELRRGKPTA